MVSRALLLDLLINARERYETVMAVGWSRVDIQGDIEAARTLRGHENREYPFDPAVPVAPVHPQSIQQHRERAWLQWQPDRVRLEQTSEELYHGQPSSTFNMVFVFNDGWWKLSQGDTYIANHQPQARDRIHTSFLSRLLNCLDPAPMVPALEFREITEVAFLNRPCYQVHAISRPAPLPLRFPEDHILEGPPGFPAADRFELIVDAERGVILRFSAFNNETEYGVWEIEDITFDVPLSDELFADAGPPR